ncbi:MAG TPA: tetratricopeptide repeat protein [Candidatus Obscuribacterales bacterium]
MVKIQILIACCALAFPQVAYAEGITDLIKSGVAAYNTGAYKDAQKIFSDAMNQGAHNYGAMDGRMGRIYSNLGESYSADGNYYYATAYLKRALQVKEKAFGADSFELVPTLNDLGKVAAARGKYPEAQADYNRALAIAEKSGQKGAAAYVGIIESNLGAMYYYEGKNGAAITHFKRGLPIAEQLYGSEHDFVLNAVKMYSHCLKAVGSAQTAKQVEDLAVARAREAISPLEQWKKNFSAAESAADAGKNREADRLYRTAIPWAEQMPDKMPLAITLTRVAHLCLKSGKDVEALEFLKRAQPLSEKELGTDDPQVIKHAEELADLATAQGRYDQAEPYYLQVLVYNKKQFGAQSEQMHGTLAKLGVLYRSNGAYDNATKVLTRAVAIDESTYGDADPRNVADLTGLADAYRGDLKFDQSENTYKRAVNILEKQPSSEASLADLLEQFSKLPQQLSQWDKAEVLLKRAVALCQKRPGKDNADLIAALQSYANMLRSASQRDRAEPIEERITALKAHGSAAAINKPVTNLDKALE